VLPFLALPPLPLLVAVRGIATIGEGVFDVAVLVLAVIFAVSIIIEIRFEPSALLSVGTINLIHLIRAWIVQV
jgi:hypothetical protein